MGYFDNEFYTSFRRRFKEEIAKTEEATKTSLNDDYIWVEGYKGTNENMECYGGGVGHYGLYGEFAMTQYRLDEEFEIDGYPELCKNGFHFCKELRQVTQYYSFDFKNRYFKVKAYVRKNDWEKDSEKYVAKKIIFIEEVTMPFDFICNLKGELYHNGSWLNKSEYELITVEKVYNTPEDMWNDRFVKVMREYGFCDEMIEFFTEGLNFQEKKAAEKYLKALKAQGVSNDVFYATAFYTLKAVPF